MKPELDRWFGAAAVIQKIYRTAVVKRHLSKKAKLSILQMIYMSMSFGLWLKEGDGGFKRLKGVSSKRWLGSGVRSRADVTLCRKEPAQVVWTCDWHASCRAFLWWNSGHVQLGQDPVVELIGRIIFLTGLGKASGSPRRSWKMLLERRTTFCHCDPFPDDSEWMEVFD